MVRTVIAYMEKRCKVIADASLDLVPVRTDQSPIDNIVRQRLWEIDTSQLAESSVINAHEMNELVSDRPV